MNLNENDIKKLDLAFKSQGKSFAEEELRVIGRRMLLNIEFRKLFESKGSEDTKRGFESDAVTSPRANELGSQRKSESIADLPQARVNAYASSLLKAHPYLLNKVQFGAYTDPKQTADANANPKAHEAAPRLQPGAKPSCSNANTLTR